LREWAWAGRDLRAVAALGDRMLADIGTESADGEREEVRPFWQPIAGELLGRPGASVSAVGWIVTGVRPQARNRRRSLP
jgi:hypothetical protein